MHTNGGIPDKAITLSSDGGRSSGVFVTAIGRAKAERIRLFAQIQSRAPFIERGSIAVSHSPRDAGVLVWDSVPLGD